MVADAQSESFVINQPAKVPLNSATLFGN
jgi:hypothetical protein